jgi:hypothetical protein
VHLKFALYLPQEAGFLVEPVCLYPPNAKKGKVCQNETVGFLSV